MEVTHSRFNIFVFGHPFIKRLGVYVFSDPSRYNFGLAPDKFDIKIHGFGGLCLKNDRFNRIHRKDSHLENCHIVFI